MDELLAIARDFNLVIVEDAAESLGSYYCGRHTGTFGLLGALSFQWQQDHHHRRWWCDSDQQHGSGRCVQSI